MNSRERMIIALSHGVADRVPCSPDMSNMIPCRLTGKPFWEVLFYGRPPIWKAYVDAARYFGIDAFFFHASPGPNPRAHFTVERAVIAQRPDRIVVDTCYHTPDGDAHEEWTYMIADSETCTRKAFDSIKQAMPILRHILSDDIDGDFSPTEEMKRYINGEFAIGGYCNTPMLPYHWLRGQLEAAVLEYYDDPEVLHEYRDLFHRYNVRKAELFLDYGVDFLLIESSGSLTMQSLEIIRDMQLPTLKAITRMCREAGVPSMFHCCGRSRDLLPLLANETDLDGIQPLEGPPTGDIDMGDAKRLYGDRLVLMGNLNTTELMLRGTPEDVYRAACQLIEQCKPGGGFILSTGDQCGRDTPDENIRAMLRAVEDCGKY